MTDKRIAWIDVLKCIGIYEIYLGHYTTAAGWAYSFVFSHHVALFFFVAGAMETQSKQQGSSIWRYIQKKCKTLLVPYLLFALLSTMVKVITENLTITEALPFVGELAVGAVRNHVFASPLWFLTCMFVVTVLFAFIKKLRRPVLIFAACFASYLVAIFLIKPTPAQEPHWFFNFDSALYYLIFFGMGYILFPLVNRLLTSPTRKSRAFLGVSGFLVSIYTVLLFFQKDVCRMLAGLVGFQVVTPILRAMLVIYFWILVAYLLRNQTLLAKIGRNTLYLCGSEYIIKNTFPYMIELLGLGISLSSPMATYIYSAIVLYLAYRFLVPLEKKLIAFCTNGITFKRRTAEQ